MTRTVWHPQSAKHTRHKACACKIKSIHSQPKMGDHVWCFQQETKDRCAGDNPVRGTLGAKEVQHRKAEIKEDSA